MKKAMQGFTLVELLLVMIIIGVVLGIGFSVMSSIIRSSAKSSIINLVKENGDFAVETMTRSIREAVDVCAGNNPSDASQKQILIYTTKVTCGVSAPVPDVTFNCAPGSAGSNGSITRTEKGGASSTLTNQSGGNSFGIKVDTCSRFEASDTTPKRVTIDFTLTQGVGLEGNSDTTASIPFHSEVTLRNF